MTENKRFTTSDTDVLCMTIIDNENGKHYGYAKDIAIVMNDLNDENERLKRINKGQELEIVRLHKLADAMSSVLRELGIYDVYDDEKIEKIKNKVRGDV